MDEFLVFEIGYSSNEIWNELSHGRKVLKIGQFSATQGERLEVTNGQRTQFCFSLQIESFLCQCQQQKQGHKDKDASSREARQPPS